MPRAESPCLDEQTLAEFVSGELDGAALDTVEAHLAVCAECRRVVADAAHGASDPTLPSAGGQEPFGLEAGQVLAGKYRIEGPLGRGGMGVVIAARHIELGHRVAIKILDCADQSAADRFLREAKTSAQLINDHIVRVFDLGRLPSGTPYFVMEHLSGRDLGALLARGRIPIPLAVEYVAQACAALKEAHAMGVVHRDLKPSNLFIVDRSDGQPWLKVLDFGISKSISLPGEPASHTTLTQPDVILGSPLYMSPEQVRGASSIDARTDIWSMGVILYELLTGQKPFRGRSLSAALVDIATEPPPLPSSIVPELPSALEALVLRCLEKDPGARFPTVEALTKALASFRIATSDAPTPATSQRSKRSRRALILALGIASSFLSGWALWGPRSLEASPTAPAPNVETRALEARTPRPELVVRCDVPWPPGEIRWVNSAGGSPGSPWPVARWCEAAASAERRRELSSSLPGPFEPWHVRLEPPHPFYAIEQQQEPERLDLHLARAERVSVLLELAGPDCHEVERVQVFEPERPAQSAVTARRFGTRADGCEWQVELPFGAFGKRLSLQLEPRHYATAEATFQSERLALRVERVRATRRHGTAIDACLPPKFCRD